MTHLAIVSEKSHGHGPYLCYLLSDVSPDKKKNGLFYQFCLTEERDSRLWRRKLLYSFSCTHVFSGDISELVAMIIVVAAEEVVAVAVIGLV